MPTVNATGVVCRAPWGGILFLKRADGNFTGHWGLPGGGIDDGETAERAAHRELLEETGHYLTGDMAELHTADNGFVTHMAHVPEAFTPTLNGEHSEFVWALPDNPPAPLHPGVKTMIASVDPAVWQAPADAALDPLGANDHLRLAMDRSSFRSKDKDGRLHVAISHISKANVCPYLGREIPGWRALGLDPDRTYQLYRDADELAKAALTFNNVPLLSEHVPVDALDHHPELVIGSTGTDAEFNAPYLDNSLVVWVARAISDIESEVSCEISSAYYYTPDMTPGEVDGVPFDGVMRDIVANHVAIVPEGRAGPDVIVGDSKKEDEPMTTAKLSRKAVEVRGALIAYLAPKLAADAKIDLSKPLVGMDAKNYIAKKPAIIAALKSTVTGNLAADATLDDLNLLLDKLDEAGVDPEAMDEDDDAGDPGNKVAGDAEKIDAAKEFLKGKLSPEDYAAFEAALTEGGDDLAGDEEEDGGEKPEVVTKAAMDAAIASAVAKAKNDAAREQAAITTALRTVRPWVGELAMSFDSAEGVLRHTLGLLGVSKSKTIHASALEDLLLAQPKPNARSTERPAMDASAAKSYAERFPNAARVRTY